MSYDSDFYDLINAGSLRSAEKIVPEIMRLLQPETVLDFGCGEGAWLSVFAKHGCTVTGLDGPYVDSTRLLIPRDSFFPVDLERVVGVQMGPSDLVISLEVAEHLPENLADSFVDALTRHSQFVLFSAAVPGQGGVGHLNEQWPAYWVEKFNIRGYRVTGALRWKFWNDAPELVENWYAQNLLLAVAEEALEPPVKANIGMFVRDLFEGPMAEPFPVVHPVLWDSRR